MPAKHIQNLCDPAKAVRSGKFTAIQSQLKKQKNLNLTLHLKQQEPKKKKNLKFSRRKETKEIRAETNLIEMKKTIAGSMKLKAGSLRR